MNRTQRKLYIVTNAPVVDRIDLVSPHRFFCTDNSGIYKIAQVIWKVRMDSGQPPVELPGHSNHHIGGWGEKIGFG